MVEFWKTQRCSMSRVSPKSPCLCCFLTPLGLHALPLLCGVGGPFCTALPLLGQGLLRRAPPPPPLQLSGHTTGFL